MINNPRGFTLVEVLIYLGLYAIVIGGAMVGAYSIFESSAHDETKAQVEEEGAYLEGKIDWILGNVKTISAPASGASGSTLSVVELDNTTVTLALNAGAVQLQGETLNSSHVSLGDTLVFIHTGATSDGINPESIEARFTVTATTTSGFTFSQNFSTVKYLRK